MVVAYANHSTSFPLLTHPYVCLVHWLRQSEKCIRANNDYRNMVMYLASVTDLHDLELDARQYLLTEVMALRGRVDHQAESVELLNAQASKLEGNHGRMAAYWFSKSAASAEKGRARGARRGK